jgi:hypothetical protein
VEGNEKKLAAAHGGGIATLAAEYGPQVFGLTAPQLAVLEACLPRIRAQRKLDEYKAGRRPHMHPDDLYDCVLEATGSEKLANAYRVARIRADWKNS